MEKNGLVINDKSFKDILEGRKKTPWLDFTRPISQATSNKELLDLTSGIGRLDKFLFRMTGWSIGGAYFDGIMRTEHSSRVKATQHPTQTGVTFTDHAFIEPAGLTIEIMMSDCHSSAFTPSGDFLADIQNAVKIIKPYTNLATLNTYAAKGEGRSAAAWLLLKTMQLSRMPLVVDTRLGTYNNMLIEELSAPDDLKTLHALRCTVRLKEVIVANVSETKVSARPTATPPTQGGQTQAQSGDNSQSWISSKSTK